jgi:hypothetical protein
MLGFGSANFNQGRFGIGVQQGFVKPLSTADVQVANHVIWAGYPNYSINASSTALIYGGLVQGAFLDIQGTSTIYANNILMIWDGNLNLGVGTSTMYSFGKIAWDSQLVSDATWTNQTVS